MKIEFTKEELDYLACKIAGILRCRAIPRDIVKDFEEGPALPADVPLSEIKMSTRLWSVIRSYGLQDWTPRDVAYYRGVEWKRLRGLGLKSYEELRGILKSAGLVFGSYMFRRGKNHREIIFDKPTEKQS